MAGPRRSKVKLEDATLSTTGFFEFSPADLARFPGGEQCVESCHVSGRRGFFSGPESPTLGTPRPVFTPMCVWGLPMYLLSSHRNRRGI